MLDLTTPAEIKALEAGKYKAFSGIDLRSIKDKVAEIAHHIGRDSIFSQYTRHDISHINQMLKSLDWIIPKSTADKMGDGDWLMLVLSIYFHDLGMVVTKDEYNRRGESDYHKYVEDLSNTANAEYIDKIQKLDDSEIFLYQEFVRSNHALRIKNWINGQPATYLGVADVVFSEIQKMLINLDDEFRSDLGIVCESHHQDDLENFKKYEVRKPYGTDPNERVNLHYAALILRTADLLHITSDRTPSIEYKLINPSDPISQDEWAKQDAVKTVYFKEVRVDNIVIPDAQSDTVEITAKFRGAAAANGFFGLSSYIQYATGELKKNYEWGQKAKKNEHSLYEFPWNKIDDNRVKTEGFEPKRFEFKLDQGKILQLLVGHTLYNDSTVVMRELIQNSLDALKLQAFIENKDDTALAGGVINITWNNRTRLLSFTDNGCGMTQQIIEDHLLTVGSSRYQSDSFKKDFPNFTPISRFGIGILTCFLIADNIEITTSHSDEPEARKLTIRNVSGKYLLQHLNKRELNDQIRTHGTSVQLEVRADVELDDLLNQISKWIVFPAYPVFLKIDEEEKTRIGFDSPKKAIESLLKERGYSPDNKRIKVTEESLDGVTIAYALRYNSFYKEWTMLKSRPDKTKDTIEVGTCIEGVRVEFESPGFKDNDIIAIANASGKHAPKTNVARSNIENANGDDFYLKSIYSLYVRYLQNELTGLQEHHSFSLSWAAGELKFLLEPLLSDEDTPHRRTQSLLLIKNPSLFVTAVRNATLTLIERDRKRYLESINNLDLIEDLWMVDSSMFRSIESLLKESKGNATLLELVKTLNTRIDNLEHLTSLLCGFDYSEIIHDQVVRNRFISEVKVFPIDRRVDICWSNKMQNWTSIGEMGDINQYTGTESNKTFFVQHEDYILESGEGIAVVECFNLIFLVKGTPIWDFFTKLIGIFDSSTEDDSRLFEFLISFIKGVYSFRNDTTRFDLKEINSKLNAHNMRYGSDLLNSIWKRVNRADYINAIANTSWNVFTPAAWDRGHLYLMEDNDLPF